MKWAEFLLHIQEVLGSNSDPQKISRGLSKPFKQMPEEYLK
jgi:hypothetical protein